MTGEKKGITSSIDCARIIDSNRSIDAHPDRQGADYTDTDRRRFLKTSTALAGLGSSLSLLVAPKVAVTATIAWIDKSSSNHYSDDPGIQNLTINININRDDLDDWVLIENLTEQPLVLQRFIPQWVSYNDWELDLNALLSRQQRGKDQLEIWPNYAWSHSVKGAVRKINTQTTLSPLSESVTGNFDATGNLIKMAGNRSLQLPCCVGVDGIVRLINS